MGKRQDSRDRIERDVIALGRRHLAESGAAGLSVRAIARELGMVSSAIYRYVSSRDDLLTVLLVDAYNELADAVDGARRAADATWHDQVLAMARAARQWAIGQPACWALLYGSPVPGYHAPATSTVGPGTRAIAALLDSVSEGIAAGDVPVSRGVSGRQLSHDFDRLRDEFGFGGDDAIVMKCLLFWAGLIGAISLETFGQYGADTITDAEAVFDGQIALLIDVFRAPSAPPAPA